MSEKELMKRSILIEKKWASYYHRIEMVSKEIQVKPVSYEEGLAGFSFELISGVSLRFRLLWEENVMECYVIENNSIIDKLLSRFSKNYKGDSLFIKKILEAYN